MAGTQDGGECFCGVQVEIGHAYTLLGLQIRTTVSVFSQIPDPSLLLLDAQCNSICAGDSSETCGGLMMNSVYKTGIEIGRCHCLVFICMPVNLVNSTSEI